MLNFFKKIAIVTNAILFSLLFTACSEDDTVESTKPQVVKLPVVIAPLIGQKSDLLTYELEYNNKHQVINIKYFDTKGSVRGVTTVQFTYDEKGRPATKMRLPGDGNSIAKSSFIYDETGHSVNITDTYGSTNTGSYTIPIDKNGYLVSEKDINESQYYEYDKNYNMLANISEFTNFGANYVLKFTQTYDKFYSPYLNLNFPAWFISLGMTELPFENISGLNFLSTLSHLQTKIEKGKEDQILVTEAKKFTVLKDLDNYPVEILVNWEEALLGQEKYTGAYSYGITYKNVN